MKTKKVFDSFALLAYLNLEEGSGMVKDFLLDENTLVMINEFNLGEVYYILARGRGPDQAEYFLNTILPSLPLHRAGNTFRDVIEAAKIKGQYALSYADCFAVATAIKEKATVVTGDPEFRKVEGLVSIDWLGLKQEKDGEGGGSAESSSK